MKKTLTMLVLLSSLIFSCGESKNMEKDDSVVKVGVPLPLTGDFAQYGESIKEGIKLKIDKINVNGGIAGKTFEMDYVDSKGDIQENVNIFKQMVSNNVDIIIGEATSSNTLAIAELAQRAKIPMITPAATSMAATENKDQVFRITFTDPYQGEIIAKYMKKSNVSKVAILTNSSSDYSTGVVKAFIEESKKQGLEVTEAKYTKEDKDFKSILTDIKNKGIDTVFIPDYYNTVGLILSQAREVGLDANFYGADGWDGIQTNFAKVAEGSIFASQFVHTDNSEANINFIKEYKEKYDKLPNIFAALGYDAATVLVDAVSKGGDLKEAIKSTDLELITGHIVFDENRNPKKDVLFVEVKDGKVLLKEKFGE
ncbi:ABC transporter substrate-binding protein [Oceanivirga salmonicida]|uniref:ABC transporter substrate-binding protein n=1 Tax=Oceanivirga salmonicida TaxID=1769291 RepID=UPI00082D3900|nr:ABC transporter substrate-binding protein [Oceanivirga salmonicida]